MIINRQAKVGLFEKNLTNERGLFIFDFNTQEKKYLEGYLDGRPEDISPDGQRIAITINSSRTKYRRTDLVVIDHKTKFILLDTYKYYIYDAFFDSTGTQLLIVAHNKKPFCIDISKNEVTAEIPKNVRLYKGDLNLIDNKFITPCEIAKGTCYVFDFKTGITTQRKIGIKEKIDRIKYSVDFTSIYVITEKNVLFCFDMNFKIKWSKDFNDLGRIPSDIFSTEDGKHIAVEADTKTNKWGSEFVINAKNGKLINQIEGYQYRGRLACNHFKNKVLLHTFRTLDLITGEECDSRMV